jgi:hypothetical protein
MCISIEEIREASLESDFVYKKMKSTLHREIEQERQAWLKAGMSEADIFRIHYGDDNGSGITSGDDEEYVYPGDYAIWLKERSHTRDDYKYIGKRVFLDDNMSDDNSEFDILTFSDTIGKLCDEMVNIPIKIDFERAFAKLTDKQKYYFTEVCLNGRTLKDVAAECGRHHSVVDDGVKLARKNLQKYF